MIEVIAIVSVLLNQNAFFTNLYVPLPIQTPSAQIQLAPYTTKPVINAKAALVYDYNTNQILFHKNSTQPLPIASITKLLTALVIDQEHKPNEIVQVTPAGLETVPVIANLRIGEELTINNLLHALLIKSANDAARVLAIHNSNDIPSFAEKLNQKALDLGMQNTSISNPSGLDTSSNTATAIDLLNLSRALLTKPQLLEIVRKQEFTFRNEANTITHDVTTTNQLLNSDYKVVGLKTGTTPEAGQCFIAITQEAEPKIVVLLNSPNRFQETKLLLDWAQTKTKNIQLNQP